MKKFRSLIALFGILLFLSCSNDDIVITNTNPDPEVIVNEDEGIDNFIWQAMNLVYLYKANVRDLADDRFTSDQTYQEFLSTFKTPEELFDGLTASQDRFSFIVDDYIALEQQFSGVSKSDGMDFGLVLAAENSDDVLGYVRYVLPGTDAEAKGVRRGEFFSTIDGEKLTRSSDFNEIFSRDSYEVGFVTIDNGIITPARTLSLTKVEYTENPILISKNIEYKGKRIGYLMYNGFTRGFNAELNQAFADFKGNIDELVVDLRYNGGGSVATAIGLGGMITGQFTGEIFLKQTWNAALQAQFTSGVEGEEALIERFRDDIAVSDETTEPLNSLNLSKVHILTTDRTASASELIINSLDPYIDVIQIGTTTVGKFQASATFYDSQNLGRENANPNHTYAIQPLIYESSNKNGVGGFINGLDPDIVFQESLLDLGTLGEVDEPFLKAALDFIADGTLPTKKKSAMTITETLGETKMFQPNYQRMYMDNVTLPNLK